MKIIRVYHFQLCQLTHALKECDEVIWSRLGIVRFVGLLVSRSKKMNLIYLSSHFLFYFLFYFSIFLFLEQLGLGLIGHAVTSITTWWHSHKTDHKTWENEVEDSGKITSYNMDTTWLFRVGCTVVSTDHL